MTYYTIRLFDGLISICECTGRDKKALKNMGEVTQLYEYDVFWEWWRKKVEYQGEGTVFVIVTDMEAFDVPEDIKIKKVEHIVNFHQDLLEGMPTNSNIITKPENISLDQKTRKLIEKKAVKIPRNHHSLEHYFVKETSRLRS